MSKDRLILVNRLVCGAVTLALILSGISFSCAADVVTAARHVKQIIAHRGASSERPECTLAAIHRAIEVGATAVEMDVRTSKDGVLFLLHDTTLDRTTGGTGPAAVLTIDQLKELDAGSWFDPAYKNERIPTLREALTACRSKIDVVLDLKEQGAAYAHQVADEVRRFGEAPRTIVGVRSHTGFETECFESRGEDLTYGEFVIDDENPFGGFGGQGSEGIHRFSLGWVRGITLCGPNIVLEAAGRKWSVGGSPSRDLLPALPRFLIDGQWDGERVDALHGVPDRHGGRIDLPFRNLEQEFVVHLQ